MNAEAAMILSALAGEIRDLFRTNTVFQVEDVAAELRAAEQALERAAARLENAP